MILTIYKQYEDIHNNYVKIITIYDKINIIDNNNRYNEEKLKNFILTYEKNIKNKEEINNLFYKYRNEFTDKFNKEELRVNEKFKYFDYEIMKIKQMI
jgi:hypothetical protein